MLLAALLLGVPGQARADFHLWDIVEVFSNADGSIQYIELFTSSGGQEFLAGHSITATSTHGGTDTVRVFDFEYDLAAGTANERFLIATPGFANLPGAPTPDYILPCGPFFDPDADTIEIDFAGWDVVSFTSAQLPVDGVNAIDDGDNSVANSPEPYQAAGGSLSLTGCQISGACDACDDGAYCNGAETCSGTQCSATNPCPGEMCDEAADACVECLAPADCDDENDCTDDVCNAGTCGHTNNSDACDDGLFCTATDTCAAGACSGSGDPCSGDMCSEAMNACVECLTPGDCSDGMYCNGAETCTLGSCGAGSPPCVGDEMCDEAGDTCVECLDAGDCDDDNVCTDDSCPAGTCMHVNNTDGCDDGLFCTATDVCSSGTCTGSGDACPGQNCLEGMDACGNCTDASDCDDANPCTVNTCDSNVCMTSNQPDDSACDDNGAFCDGAESCQAGVCTGDGNPCTSGTCDESLDACRTGCGDAIVSGAEGCDDGNQDSGDGCDDACGVETGYACTLSGNRSVCEVLFGDGLVAGDEVCDDGNQDPDDGCFEGAVSDGYTCDDAEPSVCAEVLPDAGVDAGTGDAGTATDAGAPAADASAPGAGDSTDGGTTGAPMADAPDAAAPGLGGSETDASSDDGDDGDDDGCSCRAAGAPSAGTLLPWLASLSVLLGSRRRSRRRIR